MATRPTEFPRWATVPTADPTYGVTNVVEPTEQRKDTGWLVEYPTANVQNWHMNLTYLWIAYLDEIRQSIPFAIAAETSSNQYAFDFGGYFTAYDDEMFFRARFPTNNSGSVQCNVDGLGLKDLVDNGQAQQYIGGEIELSKEYLIAYSVGSGNLRTINRVSATDAVLLAGVAKTFDITPYDLSRVIQRHSYVFANTSGTDTYTASLTPNLVAGNLVNGSTFHLYFSNANTASSPTLNIDGTGSYEIQSFEGTTLIAGDIPAASRITVTFTDTHYKIISMVCDKTGTLTNGGASKSIAVTPFSLAQRTATTERTGIAELATNAEVQTGTDTARVSPVSSMSHHKLIPKAIASADGRVAALALNYGVNIDSVDHISSGVIRFNAASGITINNHIEIPGSGRIENGKNTTAQIGARTSTAWNVETSQTDLGNGEVDASHVTIAVFGNFA